ncbi:ThiF family adenylyltransferase [Pseudotabrizicola sp. L79]|uniref:ThiF family adenylyltransferase n=1 Tax=Pseudotabrizicola sp. L79 TaxID=3118402 RepID=UPI002F95AED4
MAEEVLHGWWVEFGDPIDVVDCPIKAVRTLAGLINEGDAMGVSLVGVRQARDGQSAALLLEVEVERPQELAAPIRRIEPIAVVFGGESIQPSVLALRLDFPETMHQNWTPEGFPRSICIDDRPWQEGRLTHTPADFLKRIQLWLAKAASGELHDQAQPLEPLFFLNPMKLVIPRDALRAGDQPAELVGFLRSDNKSIIITQLANPNRNEAAAFVVIPVSVPPQGMRRIQFAPQSLIGLARQLAGSGVDLVSLLRQRLSSWAGLGNDAVRRLNARIVIVVAFPVTDETGRIAHDLRAFVTHDRAGDVGVGMGLLSQNNSGEGSSSGYVRILGAGTDPDLSIMRIEPADVHLGFDRDTGYAVSGQVEPDRRKAVLIGAGSLGSHLATNLAREGHFDWTIVDDDILLPHNFARHALFPHDTGAPKAPALAHYVSSLTGDTAHGLKADILTADGQVYTSLADAISNADIILDASASVAVSRHISDLNGTARCISIFFNPQGSAIVLLAESSDRSIRLNDLEAQYHHLVQTRSDLGAHLRVPGGGLRYSGSCRAVTNRIPASSAALLGAIASRAVIEAAKVPSARVSIWTVLEDLSVSVSHEDGEAVERVSFGTWVVSYGASVVQEIAHCRAENLPKETGGVLLGIVDTSRQTIQIVRAMSAPLDSSGSVQSFERGVVGLADAVKEASERSLYQVRYVGEWHSHPVGSSTIPSVTDIRQITWLTEELRNEGLPALMGIAGDNLAFRLILGDWQSVDADEAIH